MKKNLLFTAVVLAIFAGCDDKDTTAVTGVTVSPAAQSVAVGGTFTATATVQPAGANKAVTWSSSDEAIATVSDAGLVTGKAEGSATITATTVDGGHTATVAVKVTVAPAAVTGVSVNPTTQTFPSGRTFTATATVQPTNAANKAVAWSSSDTTVATVDDAGVVFGVDMGEAVITVTTVDGGHTAFLQVTVEESEEAKAAKRLLATLGADKASVSGVTVTLTGDVTATDVNVEAGVTLAVPGEKTLTVTGTLTLSGDLTVAGAIDVAGYTLSGGTLNLSNGSKSKGLVAAPDSAASGWVWKFGNQTWSDRIAMERCKADNPVSQSTDAHCGARTNEDNVERYYYNYYYVDANNLCGDGWSLPANHSALVANTTKEHLWSVWGLGGAYDSYAEFSGSAT